MKKRTRTSKKRRYTQRKRALAVEETRQRIVAATMALHEEVGPRATTISAIAERAGVQRLTVYRHFPDEAAVFEACTSRWLELHPPPDPASWQDAHKPKERVRRALATLHAYYRETESMWAGAWRDEPDVPALQPQMAAVREYLDGIAADLIACTAGNARPSQALSAPVHHAVEFPTWQSLARQRLDDAVMAATVGAWITRRIR